MLTSFLPFDEAHAMEVTLEGEDWKRLDFFNKFYHPHIQQTKRLILLGLSFLKKEREDRASTR